MVAMTCRQHRKLKGLGTGIDINVPVNIYKGKKENFIKRNIGKILLVIILIELLIFYIRG